MVPIDMAAADAAQPKPQMPPLHVSDSPGVLHKRKRTGTACNSCRLHKTKCDGSRPCQMCVKRGWLCQYDRRRRQFPKMSQSTRYLETLEESHCQLTHAVCAMYHKLVKVGAWDFEDVGENEDGEPIVHNIIQAFQTPTSHPPDLTTRSSFSSSISPPPTPVPDPVSSKTKTRKGSKLGGEEEAGGHDTDERQDVEVDADPWASHDLSAESKDAFRAYTSFPPVSEPLRLTAPTDVLLAEQYNQLDYSSADDDPNFADFSAFHPDPGVYGHDRSTNSVSMADVIPPLHGQEMSTSQPVPEWLSTMFEMRNPGFPSPVPR